MICGNCKEDKADAEFSFKNKAIGKRATTCKVCHRKHSATYYAKNKAECVKESLRRNKIVLDSNRKNVLLYLEGKCCVDCGESDPVVLEFDHVDPKTKAGNISNMLRNCHSFETIFNEIKKCEIRCANCHRRRTAKQFGHFRYKIAG